MTTSNEKLVKVKITTELEAVYEFPDMFLSALDTLIASENLHGFAQVSLVNASSACLVLPSRIIKTIEVDGEVKWRSRA
jgi:hypothetical protein